MTEIPVSPMIKFFCPKCGKEMWKIVDWSDVRRYTLAALRILLVCSDCRLKEIRADRRNDAEKDTP